MLSDSLHCALWSEGGGERGADVNQFEKGLVKVGYVSPYVMYCVSPIFVWCLVDGGGRGL